MDTDPSEPQVEPRETRRAYEAPLLRTVELLPSETLGLGCKTEAEALCQINFANFGS